MVRKMFMDEFGELHFSPNWEQRIRRQYAPYEIWAPVEFAWVDEDVVRIPVFYHRTEVGTMNYLGTDIKFAVDKLLKTPEWIINHVFEDEIEDIIRKDYAALTDEDINEQAIWNGYACDDCWRTDGTHDPSVEH
jgi:hypothetical protein